MLEDLERNNPFGEVLSYFRAGDELAKYARNFDDIRESYVSAQSHSGEGVSGIENMLKKVIFEQIFFNLLTAAKLKYIFGGASDCFKSENVIGLAAFSRSALEHIATYASTIKRLESTVKKLTGQNNLKQIEGYLKKLSEYYHVSYYGTGHGNDKRNKAPKPIHINDAIIDLDSYFGEVGTSTKQDEKPSRSHSFLFQEAIATREEVIEKFGIPIDPFPKTGVIRADYDFLCDFIHPNYGSNFLVTSGTLAEGLIDTPSEHVRNLNFLFVRKCLRYWIYYKELVLQDSYAGIRLDSWLRRSQKKGAKATRIFSKKAPKYDGDGKSIKTAYSFPFARDRAEEHEMFLKLLSDLKSRKYKQSIAEFGQGDIVDRIELDNGKFVFVRWKSKNLPV